MVPEAGPSKNVNDQLLANIRINDNFWSASRVLPVFSEKNQAQVWRAINLAAASQLAGIPLAATMTGAVSAFAPPIALPGLMALHGQPGWLGRGTDLSHPRRAFAPASSDVQLLPPPRAFHLMASSLGKGHQGATAGFGGVGSRSTLPSSRSPSTVEWTCFGVGKRAGRRNVVVAASGEVIYGPCPAPACIA